MASKMSHFSPSDAKVTKIEPMPDAEARWIRLRKITYTDPSGTSRIWESAERRTRPRDADVDGVGVIAVLHDRSRGAPPRLLLQKQFRPPVDRVTIEVPSGLVDAGESARDAALRELREETGYVATVAGGDGAAMAEGFVMFNDPGFCNTNTKMIFVDVDMEDPRNQAESLRPELEENEYIECFSLPLDTLWEDLRQLDAEGYAIDARVGTLAQGWEMARRWRGAVEKV